MTSHPAPEQVPEYPKQVLEYPKALLQKFFPHPTDADQAPRGLGKQEVPEGRLLYQSEGYAGGEASDLRVLGIAPDAAACGHYRVTFPLMLLAERGAQVSVFTASPQLPLQAFLGADVVYLSRACTDATLRNVLAVRQLTGAAVVYDLDDCLHEVSPSNPAFGAYDLGTPAGRATLESVKGFLRACDGAILSTRELAAYYGADTRYPHLLFNGLDLTLGERDWSLLGPRFDWRAAAARQGCAVDGDSLLFGWAGSGTHHDSLRELGDAVARVLAQTKNTFFGIYTDPYLACRFCVEQWGLPLRRVVYLPVTPFQGHPRVLSAFDVALAPLRNDVFNRCKSPLRLLEFGAWGVPYVASKVAPYWRFHRETEGRAGLIASDPEEFAAHTVRLLGDGDERAQKGELVRNHVREYYDIRRTMTALPETLQAIRKAQKSALHRPSAQFVQDACTGIPRVVSPGHPAEGPCPCGSGEAYEKCPHGCVPAFGSF